MPLTAFQQTVARLLASARTPDSYLAGGAALHIAPNSLRYSNDLDYFNDSEERVASAFTSDRSTLVAAGLTVAVKIERPGFIRAIVAQGRAPTADSTANSTKVEWVHDTAWRFLPVVADEVAGYCLHPIDLAVNKLLALVGRDEPRDFLDTLDVHARILELGALVWAGAGKDPGFTPSLLLGLLRRRGRYREDDFQRLRVVTRPDLQQLKQDWLQALDDAEAFVSARPPDEMGCLYYSPVSRAFPRKPADHADVVPHYGRPGGVLPSVG